MVLALASGCARDGFEDAGAPESENAMGGSPSDAGAGNADPVPPSAKDGAAPPLTGGETPTVDVGSAESSAPDAGSGAASAESCDAPAIPEEVSLPGGAVISDVHLDGGGNRASVAAGQAFTLALSFKSELSSCLAVTSPLRVLKVGFTDGPSECSDPELCTTRSTPFEVSLKAPSTPGNYELHAEFQGIVSPTASCAGLQLARDGSTHVATICVH
jgi:hypothetical protein